MCKEGMKEKGKCLQEKKRLCGPKLYLIGNHASQLKELFLFYHTNSKHKRVRVFSFISSFLPPTFLSFLSPTNSWLVIHEGVQFQLPLNITQYFLFFYHSIMFSVFLSFNLSLFYYSSNPFFTCTIVICDLSLRRCAWFKHIQIERAKQCIQHSKTRVMSFAYPKLYFTCTWSISVDWKQNPLYLFIFFLCA